MTREADMVRRKAKTMNEGAVRDELKRIDRGIACAVGDGARKRYETRRSIFQERLKQLVERPAPTIRLRSGRIITMPRRSL